MDNKIDWSDEYLFGINNIDEEHKIAIETVNELYRAISQRHDKDEIIKLIEKLDFYVKIHFTTEEQYMNEFDYPNSYMHIKAHEYFKNTYEQIRYNYFYIDNKGMPKREFINIYAIHLCQTLIDWLIFHLDVFDKEFALYIKSKKNIT